MESLFTLDAFISLLSLTLMEIVLGIDNIIFISILCNRLPESQQEIQKNPLLDYRLEYLFFEALLMIVSIHFSQFLILIFLAETSSSLLEACS